MKELLRKHGLKIYAILITTIFLWQYSELNKDVTRLNFEMAELLREKYSLEERLYKSTDSNEYLTLKVDSLQELLHKNELELE